MIAALLAAVLQAPEPAGLGLVWEAPPGCPAGEEVRARVVRLVGEEAVQRARLVARGQVRADAGAWALELELAGETGGGRRTLRADRCEGLLGAAALVIAIAVDPRAALAGAAEPTGVVPAPPRAADEDLPTAVPVEDRGAGAPVEAEASEPAAPGPADVAALVDVPEDSREAPAPPPPPRGSGRWVGVRAAGGVSFARLLPGAGGAASVAISAGGRGWRAEVGGLYLPPVAGVAAGNAAIGGVFQAGAIELRGCPSLTRGRVELPLCAGLQVGAMQGRGRGTGLATTNVARSLWLAGSLGAALAWRPRGGRVALWLQVDAIVALIRPRFDTAGGVVVHEAARFGGQALAGLEVRVRGAAGDRPRGRSRSAPRDR